MLHRLGGRGFGQAVFRAQRLERLGGLLVDGVQGLTDRTGPNEITISFGLAGRVPQDEVRQIRLGDAGARRQLVHVPCEPFESAQDYLVEAINDPIEVAAEVRSGELVVVTAKFAQSATDRRKVGRRRRRLRRMVGAPEEPELHFRSLTPWVAGVRAHHGRVPAVDGRGRSDLERPASATRRMHRDGAFEPRCPDAARRFTPRLGRIHAQRLLQRPEPLGGVGGAGELGKVLCAHRGARFAQLPGHPRAD